MSSTEKNSVLAHEAQVPESQGSQELSTQGSDSNSTLLNPGPLVREPRLPVWAQAFPFFLSAFFYLSGFFAIFSPLPLLFLLMKKGRRWAFFGTLSNGLIVGFAGGWQSLVLYIVLIVSLVWALSELLLRKKSLEKAVAFTLFAMLLSAGVSLVILGQIHHVNPIQAFYSQVSDFVDSVVKLVSSGSNMVNPVDLDEWKRGVLQEVPSSLAIFALVLVWANLMLLLRANPNQIRERIGIDASFQKKWKTPQFLVWPVILSGFFLLMDFGVVSDISLNVFRFLMAVYAIQGLSILSYFFDLWGIRGIFRWIGYALSISLMMPLVLSLGFFDLWFDFRGKLRQS